MQNTQHSRSLTLTACVFERKTLKPYDRRFPLSPKDISEFKPGGNKDICKMVGRTGKGALPASWCLLVKGATDRYRGGGGCLAIFIYFTDTVTSGQARPREIESFIFFHFRLSLEIFISIFIYRVLAGIIGWRVLSACVTYCDK